MRLSFRSYRHHTKATLLASTTYHIRVSLKMGPIVASRLMSRLYARNLYDAHDGVPRQKPRTMERGKSIRQVLSGKLNSLRIKTSKQVKITNFQRKLEQQMKQCISSSHKHLGEVSNVEDILNYARVCTRGLQSAHQ